jgi:hypothetical protein
LAVLLVALLTALGTPVVLPGVLSDARGLLPWFPARADCSPT